MPRLHHLTVVYTGCSDAALPFEINPLSFVGGHHYSIWMRGRSNDQHRQQPARSAAKATDHQFRRSASHGKQRSVSHAYVEHEQCNLGRHFRGGKLWPERVDECHAERIHHIHGNGTRGRRNGRSDGNSDGDISDRRSSFVRKRVPGDGRKPQLLKRDRKFVDALPEQPGAGVWFGYAVFREHASLDRQLL